MRRRLSHDEIVALSDHAVPVGSDAYETVMSGRAGAALHVARDILLGLDAEEMEIEDGDAEILATALIEQAESYLR